jgi:hypothetical protein
MSTQTLLLQLPAAAAANTLKTATSTTINAQCCWLRM